MQPNLRVLLDDTVSTLIRELSHGCLVNRPQDRHGALTPEVARVCIVGSNGGTCSSGHVKAASARLTAPTHGGSSSCVSNHRAGLEWQGVAA
jgi:hypothetical protein